MNFERAIPINEAIVIANKHLRDLRIPIKVTEYHSQGKQVSVLKVSKQSDDNQNEILSSGKGLGNQSIASGLFEALEHYFYFNGINFQELIYKKPAEILDSHYRLQEHYALKSLLKDTSEKISCINFTKLNNDNEQIYIPHFLVSPSPKLKDEEIKFKKLSKYRSGNGYAIGVNKNEAIIHGVNEVIERDSLSRHFINYIFKEQKDLKIVAKNTLPERIKILLKDIEKTIQSDINIIDVTYIKELPTYYVWSHLDQKPLPIKGSGTSIFPEYALERALSELYQAYAMYDMEDYNQDLLTKILYSEKKELNRIINCDYQDAEKIKVSFPNQIKLEDRSLLNIKNYIVSAIKKIDYDVYYHTVYEKKDLHCLKIFIPGTENFQLLNHGIFTLPNNHKEIVEP